ncbi:TetR family transcriptional regulator [Microcella alkaliphila]|uniref:TetR family transcriptional regulator n=2 Tax=Microcella alkaliphila TaxID=279828 RepID=A0A4Q7TZ89_9MICO|nr:TetR family transcriptional regulator [Microcella alkaliphila]
MFMGAARGERGPYAKGIAKRAEILDAALEVIVREGYSGATVKRLADAVGLSQNGLLRYFGSKDALFAEILRRRDELANDEVDITDPDFAETLVDRLLQAVDEQVASPGMAQLSLRVTGEATEPDHLAHDFIRERYASIRKVVEDAILALQQTGRMDADIDPAAVAALVYASWDGLQIQWMYDDTIDVRARMTYLVRALGIEAMASRAAFDSKVS